MKFEQILHQHLLDKIGERTRSFLNGLSWVMRATIISRLLAGVTTLYFGIRLGTAAFGDAYVSLALTLWIQLPMFMTMFSALMHYLPQSVERDKPMWITTCLELVALFGLVTTGVGLISCSFWARVWDVPPRMVEMAIAYCIGFLLYSASTSIFSASEDFRLRAFSEIAFAVLFPLMTLAFIWSHHLSAMHYVGSLALAYALSGLGGLGIIVRRSHISKFNPAFVRPLMTYGGLATAGGLVNALLNTPARLIAHRYLASSQVGILSAYQAGSIQMASYFLAAGSQVFFPIASRTPDPVALLKKITRIFFKMAPFLFVLQILLLLMIFKILKRGGFPFQWDLALIFSIAAIAAFFHGILVWYMSSHGMRAMVFSTITGVVAGIVNIMLCVLLIKRWQVFGSGVAMTISSLVGILGCYMMAPKTTRDIVMA